jgi:hypothetical protein
MDLTPFVLTLREELTGAADALGGDAQDVADRLTTAMDSAIRLSLLEALSSAAAEITTDLAPGSVELRLRGRDPEFVVTPPPAEASEAPDGRTVTEAAAWVPADGEDATMTRINLRLSQDLKDRVEDAARQSGLSLNAWLVRSAASALAGATAADTARSGPRRSVRFTGWVR